MTTSNVSSANIGFSASMTWKQQSAFSSSQAGTAFSIISGVRSMPKTSCTLLPAGSRKIRSAAHIMILTVFSLGSCFSISFIQRFAIGFASSSVSALKSFRSVSPSNGQSALCGRRTRLAHNSSSVSNDMPPLLLPADCPSGTALHRCTRHGTSHGVFHYNHGSFRAVRPLQPYRPVLLPDTRGCLGSRLIADIRHFHRHVVPHIAADLICRGC